MSLAAQPVLNVTMDAANQLLDPSIYVQIDGEFAGRLPARLDMVPRSLTLMVPPSFRERKLHRNG